MNGINPESVARQKQLNTIAAIEHEYMERQAFPLGTPPSHWPRRFRYRALATSRLYRGRGTVAIRYPGRLRWDVPADPIDVDALDTGPMYPGKMFTLPKIPDDAFEHPRNLLILAQRMAGVPPQIFGPPTILGCRTATGMQMLLEQQERILNKWLHRA